MRANRADVYRLIGFLEGDLRGVNAKFTELRSMLAAGAMEREPRDDLRCPHCGPVANVDSERMLAFHIQNVHGGPAVELAEWERLALVAEEAEHERLAAERNAE